MIYPYLTRSIPLYGPYASYKEARDAIRKMSDAECESLVKYFWPHAFLYGHGPECTILPMDWRDTERLKIEAPEIKIPARLSMTVFIGLDWSRERQLRQENYLWRLAAFTVIEQARTKELESENQNDRKSI
jgi:hypothetical protein